MRRILYPVLIATTALAVLVPAGFAQASGFQGSRAFSPFAAYQTGAICPHWLANPDGSVPPAPPGNFGVGVSAVNNQGFGNEYMMQLPDGTTLTTGSLVLSFQNLNNTSASITGNESGTVAVSASLNDTGTGTVTYNGPESITWGPHSQAALAALGEPQPGFVLYNGQTVLTITDGAVTGFSNSGPAVDGCALLAG